VDLAATYREVRKSIVAFVPRDIPLVEGEEPPEIPPIIGTGFIVDDGLVVTNNHVVRGLARLPRPPGTPQEEWAFAALLLHEIRGEGIAQIQLEVLGVGVPRDIEVQGHYYGPRRPDLALVHVKAKGLPKLAVDSQAVPLEEGRVVATAGFPMGTDALRAPGYLHQLTPTLQQGIISAVLPFATPVPHALMINVMTQGGASGSPVFAPDRPAVIGVLYAGLHELEESPRMPAPYLVPTNLSYVVPAHYVEHMLEKIKAKNRFELPSDTMSLEEMVARFQRKVLQPRGEFGLEKERKGAQAEQIRSVKPSDMRASDH
jgi:S1-C subfamily serine protease